MHLNICIYCWLKINVIAMKRTQVSLNVNIYNDSSKKYYTSASCVCKIYFIPSSQEELWRHHTFVVSCNLFLISYLAFLCSFVFVWPYTYISQCFYIGILIICNIIIHEVCSLQRLNISCLNVKLLKLNVYKIFSYILSGYSSCV
jgi:hypothetical protein